MTRFASWAKGAATLFAVAAALVGWAVVALQDRWLDDLEDELAKARQQATASETVPAPAAASDLASAELKQLKEQLEASKAEREALQQQVRQTETALKLLRVKYEEQAKAGPDPGRPFRTVTRARLRAGPSTETAEIAVMVEGADLRVIDTVADGTWYEVRLQGYAFHELLRPSPGD